MGAGATGGWVVVGLGFGAGEEGGELGFGDVFAGGWRRHCCWRGEGALSMRKGGGDRTEGGRGQQLVWREPLGEEFWVGRLTFL